MALLDLVVGHLNASTQFGKYHHLDILILEPYSLIVFINLLVADALDDGVWIDHTARSLIDTILKEHRVLVRLSTLIGGNRHYFSPCFNHDFLFLSCW